MLRPALPIETDRLLLRPFTFADRDDALAYNSLPDVARYLYTEPYTEATFADVLAAKTRRVAIDREGDALDLVVVPREVGRVIGEVTLIWRSEQHRLGEIGFMIHPDHQGRGYAREAAEVMLRLGFEGLGLHRVVGRLDARNARSARLLERLGMRREAHLVENEWVKGEWADEVVYALLDREWRQVHG